MQTLIVYTSVHRGNTQKVAEEMGVVLGAEVVKLSEVKKEDIENADLVGFGSGIYFTTFHKGIMNFVKELPEMEEKKAFIFSTSGMKAENFFNKGHNEIRELLNEKGFEIEGEFNCRGYDTYSILKYIGGINKNRPNEDDLKSAREFAKSLKSSPE